MFRGRIPARASGGGVPPALGGGSTARGPCGTPESLGARRRLIRDVNGRRPGPGTGAGASLAPSLLVHWSRWDREEGSVSAEIVRFSCWAVLRRYRGWALVVEPSLLTLRVAERAVHRATLRDRWGRDHPYSMMGWG